MSPTNHDTLSPVKIQSSSPPRPPQIRQSSFSKRHASFDTPREVPGVQDLYFSQSRLPLIANSNSTASEDQHEPAFSKDLSSFGWPSDKRHDFKPTLFSTPASDDSHISSFSQTIHSVQKQASNFSGQLDNKYDDSFSKSESDDFVDFLSPNMAGKRRSQSSGDHVRNLPVSSNTRRPVLSPTPQRPLSTVSLPPIKQLPISVLPPPPSDESLGSADLSYERRSYPQSGTLGGSDAWSDLSALNEALSASMPAQSSPGSSSISSPPDPLSPGLSTSSIGSSSQSSLFSTISSMPPPTPPTILTPPPPPTGSKTTELGNAAHDTFLSRNPASDDCNITVETLPTEYKLVARLPGYQRDGITVAMRRRRILHIMANTWVAGGGHFERRISFGYDADVGGIRAEFDGDCLMVVVPRRFQPNPWFATNSH